MPPLMASNIHLFIPPSIEAFVQLPFGFLRSQQPKTAPQSPPFEKRCVDDGQAVECWQLLHPLSL
ncbi:hypothetical protein C7B82_00575 [Stenomitos frigidus ULC18]|uniref:Uncharacterized protein n=1 Tax=Stenomitos frigidus ULC18 TaxID=2107698 RepID=A0A2T1ESC7_9CYAN|nr:hypothetical protein C7B82_00575 [Stenomitos frigidus ULC18]